MQLSICAFCKLFYADFMKESPITYNFKQVKTKTFLTGKIPEMITSLSK